MKKTFDSIVKYIITALPWAWRFLIRAARYPTGRRLLAIAIVAAATALGLNWPLEQVQIAINTIMQGVGIDGTVSLEIIIGGVVALILGDGMFRANDTIADAQRLVLPNRIYVASMKDVPPSMAVKLIEGAQRKVAYYEIRGEELIAVAEDGAQRVLSNTAMREPEKAIYEYLKARL